MSGDKYALFQWSSWYYLKYLKREGGLEQGHRKVNKIMRGNLRKRDLVQTRDNIILETRNRPLPLIRMLFLLM